MLRSCRSHERLKGSPIVPICVPQFCGLQHLCILASASIFAADNLSVNTFAEILSDDKKISNGIKARAFVTVDNGTHEDGLKDQVYGAIG